jgi:hypothetical protein
MHRPAVEADRPLVDRLESVDAALGDLDGFLKEEVGVGNIVIAVTADNGQTPLEAGGWPIDRAEIIEDVQAKFDKTENGTGLIELTSPTVLFMNKAELKANDVTSQDVSNFLSNYTLAANVGARDSNEVPTEFADRTDELIIKAAFPGGEIPAISTCAGAPR